MNECRSSQPGDPCHPGLPVPVCGPGDRRIEVAHCAQQFDAPDLGVIGFLQRKAGVFDFLEVLEGQHGRLSGPDGMSMLPNHLDPRT